MSEQQPTYSGNPILDGLEHVGHWLHVAETDVVDAAKKLPEVVTTVKDLEDDAKTVIPAISQVVTDGAALTKTAASDTANFLASTKVMWSAFAASFAGGNFNPLAFGMAVYQAFENVPTLVKDAQVFANLPDEFSKMLADIHALDADIVASWQKLQKDVSAL